MLNKIKFPATLLFLFSSIAFLNAQSYQEAPIPEKVFLADGRTLEESDIYITIGQNDSIPLYFATNSLVAAYSHGIHQLWEGGLLNLDLKGEGISVAVWDAGAILPGHQELLGRISQQDLAISTNDHAQ